MALRKIKLGDYLIPYKEKCGIPNLTPYDISGVNKDKEFFEPSRQTGEDTANYQNVPPEYFACNLMHVGRDKVLPIAYNHTQKVKHVSPAYSIFRIKENDDLLDYYFFIWLKSNERDRFFWFNTDASIRDGMTWEDLCNVELMVPPLAVQQKYVDVYHAMLANQKSYERGLDDLKLTCDAYIEDLRRKIPSEPIGQYIYKENKNSDGKIARVLGIGQSGFMQPQKDPNESLRNYKILKSGDIAYAPPLYNVMTGALHCYREEEQAVCSPIYEVFCCKEQKLLPEYLTMWLKRDEFKRYAAYFALGVRQTFDYQLMEEVEIPIPEIGVQKAIINIFKSYNERKSLNDKLKNQIKDICPILIKGSIEEAKKEA